MKTLVLGIGNPIMGDDGVGLVAAQEVARRVGRATAITVEECYDAGPALLDRLIGFDSVVVIDSIRCDLPPGTVFEPLFGKTQTELASMDFHGMGLLGVVELGKKLGFEMPGEIRIVAVAIPDEPLIASEDLSPLVRESVPRLADAVMEVLACTPSP